MSTQQTQNNCITKQLYYHGSSTQRRCQGSSRISTDTGAGRGRALNWTGNTVLVSHVGQNGVTLNYCYSWRRWRSCVSFNKRHVSWRMGMSGGLNPLDIPRTPIRRVKENTFNNSPCPITPTSHLHNACTSFISTTDCTVCNVLMWCIDAT